MKPRDQLPAAIGRARAVRARPAPAPDVNEHTLQSALVFLARVVTTYGTQYTPLFDRIEAELEKYKRARDPVSRARQVLAEHAVEIKPPPAP